MFALLRGHKRSGSQPSSPVLTSPLHQQSFQQQQQRPPQSSHSFHSLQSASSPTWVEPPAFFNANRHPEYLSPPPNKIHADSPGSPLHPSLPPITRVASVYNKDEDSFLKVDSNSGGRRETGGLGIDSPLSIHPGHYSRSRESLSHTQERDVNGIVSPLGGGGSRYHSDNSSTSNMKGLRARGQSAFSPPTDAASRNAVNTGIRSTSLSNIPTPAANSTLPAQTSPSVFPIESHRAPLQPPSNSNYSRSTSASTAPAVQKLEKVEKRGSRLNLRNPMSLLLRRRSGQQLEQLADDSLVSRGSGANLPTNFDPSIRGKVVHDFSAPRKRPNYSTSDIQNVEPESDGRQSPPQQARDDSQGSQRVDKPHTPLFREHLDEEDHIHNANEAGVRAEQLANNSFLSRNSFAPGLDFDNMVPAFGRAKAPAPAVIDTQEGPLALALPQLTRLEAAANTGISVLSPVQENDGGGAWPSELGPQSSQRDSSTTRKPSNMITRSRATSRNSNSDWQGDGVSHMLSKSSRFSFQLNNLDSAAHERLLEDRHIQKMAAKSADVNTVPEALDEEDDFDYDAMDDDGFEEDIPTVGDDWDYGSNSAISNMSMGLNALSLDIMASLGARSQDIDDFNNCTATNQQGYNVADLASTTIEDFNIEQEPNTGADDDMYFDDGMIGAEDFNDSRPFDESVFDDPNGNLYERRKLIPPTSLEVVAASASPDDTNESMDGFNTGVEPQNSVKTMSTVPYTGASSLHPNPDASNEVVSAYQQALALAANQAAANGRFGRSHSMGNDEYLDLQHDLLGIRSVSSPYDQREGSLPNISSRPSLVPDEGRLSQGTSGFSPPLSQNEIMTPPNKAVLFTLPDMYGGDGFMSNFDANDWDTELDEDPIIAAANAEALENDDEGFYGQEFGFYARPGPIGGEDAGNDDESVFYQGGYFGPKDWSEIKRRKSTREPNLTPITERSEYSTRNSFISMAVSDRIDRDIRSPGLAVLARMSPTWDTEMNIEALMKLRRGAFGSGQGSVGSVGSDSSPLNSSPVGARNYRTTWSSPIGREVDPGDFDLDDTGYEDMLDEANFVDDEYELDEDVDEESPSSDHSHGFNPHMDAGYGTDDMERRDTIKAITPNVHVIQNLSPTITESTNSDTTPKQTPLLPVPLSLQTNLASFPQLNGTDPFSPGALASSKSATFSESPLSPSSKPRISHNRSGSDSVAYVKECDEDGEVRWVVERRRTAEGGVVEIIDRTIIESGRI